MSDEPSKSLLALLEELGLATSGQVLSVAGHVRRLAGELPPLDSVWIDALAQARLLTPFQAFEINSGRGGALRLGPYVIEQPLGENGFTTFFRARHCETLQQVHLATVERLHRPAAEYEFPLVQLVRNSAGIRHAAVRPVIAAGVAGAKVWAVCESATGLPAAKWMVDRGRFAPLAALHIARELAAGLLELERAGTWHGDLSVGSVMVSDRGEVQLVMPGLRGCVRPSEGYVFADLQPEAFDTLAPERIADGAPITTATELYAFGCVCWHLLAGRPPFAGGSSLAKLRSVHAARLVDVRRLAPECPEVLWRATAACLANDPQQRPASFAVVAEMLGTPTRQGTRILTSSLAGQSVWGGGSLRRRPRRKSRPLAAAALVVFVAGLVGTWPLWRGKVWNAVDSAKLTSEVAQSTRKAQSASPVATVGRSASPRDEMASTTKPDGEKTRRDEKVRQVAATQPVESKPKSTSTAQERHRLILPTGRLLKLQRLNIEPGQVVTGRDGARPRVQTPPGGLVVGCDDVVFENIDFVCAAGDQQGRSAFLAVQAATCTFVGCTFQAAAGKSEAGAAIEWSDGESRNAAGSELHLVDCTLYRVAAGVLCRRTDGVTLDVSNTLCAEAGPLLIIDHYPTARESVQMHLDRVTLRACSAAIACRYAALPQQPGRISVVADSSVLSPREALFVFTGSNRPDSVLRLIEWAGQGSLLTPSGVLAVWSSPGKRAEALEEEHFEVAGLVRSEVEFAGAVSADPAQSRVTDWQVPLRTDDAPGIGPSANGRGALRRAD